MSSEKIKGVSGVITGALMLYLSTANQADAIELLNADLLNTTAKTVEEFKSNDKKMKRLRKYISPIIKQMLNKTTNKSYRFIDMQITFPLAHPYSPKQGKMDYTTFYPSKPPYDGNPKIKAHFNFCFSSERNKGKQCVSTDLQQATIAQSWKAVRYYVEEVCVKTNKRIESNRLKEIELAKKDLDKLIKMGDDWKEALKDPEIMHSTYYYQLKKYYNPSPIPLSALIINVNVKNDSDWTGNVILSCWNKKPIPTYIVGDGTFGQIQSIKPGWNAFKLRFNISSY